mgnify:CR=1 FL=1
MSSKATEIAKNLPTLEHPDGSPIRALVADDEEMLKEFRAAQWDGVTGPKADVPYLWIATVQVPYFVNDQLDLGRLRVGERGQGMGILITLDQWQWKK